MSLDRQWKLNQRKVACSHSHEPFVEGEPVRTAIFWDEGEGEFRREDYKVAAWEEIRHQVKPFSFWRGVYESTEGPKKIDPVAKEDAESTLRRLIEENDPATERTRYFLALMLERKKVLQQIDSQDQDGRRLAIFKRRHTEEIFIVADPKLSLEELPEVQNEVMALLPA